MSAAFVATFNSVWVSEKIGSMMVNHSGSSIADFPLPDFVLSVNFLHCSFNHLYFARSLTTDVSIAFSFPFLEHGMFSVCKRASSSFLIFWKIWKLADFLSARVSKANANSFRSSASCIYLKLNFAPLSAASFLRVILGRHVILSVQHNSGQSSLEEIGRNASRQGRPVFILHAFNVWNVKGVG